MKIQFPKSRSSSVRRSRSKPVKNRASPVTPAEHAVRANFKDAVGVELVTSPAVSTCAAHKAPITAGLKRPNSSGSAITRDAARPIAPREGAPPSAAPQETFRTAYTGLPFFLSAATTAQVERSLARQNIVKPTGLGQDASERPMGRYLLSYDPSITQWRFSYVVDTGEGAPGFTHYPIDFDAYTQQFSVALPKGKIVGADPMTIVRRLVQRASPKVDLLHGDLDAG